MQSVCMGRVSMLHGVRAIGKQWRGERGGGSQRWGCDLALPSICRVTLGHLSGPQIPQLDMEEFGSGDH